MIVALDATALIPLLNREAAGPVDPSTGERLDRVQERLAYLVTRISKTRGGRLIIPTPALAETLVKVDPGAVEQYLSIVERLRGIRISDFDTRAAVEFADMQRGLLAQRRRIKRSELETRAKAKFDQQIVAIAKVEQATLLVSDDDGLRRFAERFGLRVARLAELPPPPESQPELALMPPGPQTDGR